MRQDEKMKSDIEIAQSCEMLPITEVALRSGIDPESLELYGKYKAKLTDESLKEIEGNKNGKLILVTAINPTPAGEGKTTVTVGLGEAFAKLNKKAIIALREPSLGPCFGIKGGAAGGGMAQVVPMEDLNLHFTGDFHAITAANNLLAALLDNHIQQGNEKRIDSRSVVWKRCMDMNDRALRNIVVGLGSKSDGFVREDHFVITVASEIMAVLCLSENLKDLKARLSRIIVAYDLDGNPVTAGDIQAVGAMTALLKDAIRPNLIQTLEHTPAIVHGGPFANIAHGCNSVIATRTALKLADYCITEAGFGADLGAEKFFDIKCRKTGLQPRLVVIVATTQGLKMHGGVDLEHIKEPNAKGLTEGLKNLNRHIRNMQGFGQPVVVTLNRYDTDTDDEIAIVRKNCVDLGVGFAVNEAFLKGGEGAEELAQTVIDTIERIQPLPIRFTYKEADQLEDKIEKVCKRIYGASAVEYGKTVRKKLEALRAYFTDEDGAIAHYPVCIAKTQFSFSADATRYGSPEGFTIRIRDIILNCGSEMIVAIAGDMLRMPGLPKSPQAERITIENGEIEGLS